MRTHFARGLTSRLQRRAQHTRTAAERWQNGGFTPHHQPCRTGLDVGLAQRMAHFRNRFRLSVCCSVLERVSRAYVGLLPPCDLVTFALVVVVCRHVDLYVRVRSLRKFPLAFFNTLILFNFYF